MLEPLGSRKGFSTDESVRIIVGPNGSGKSSFLRELVFDKYHSHNNVLVICNTPHDRFAGIKGSVPRISVGKKGSSPKDIVKKSIVKSLEGSGADFYQISKTMEYCGYRSRFGFKIMPGEYFNMSFNALMNIIEEQEIDSKMNVAIHNILKGNTDDLFNALRFVKNQNSMEYVWIDAKESALEFSLAKDFVAVIKLEKVLRELKVISGINVFLKRFDTDEIIKIHHASSGQLTLISSLVFLIAHVSEAPFIIIDEPENSLHPKWQREYVDQLLSALNYRNATFVIATHAPLIVTGALNDNTANVAVFGLKNGVPEKLPLKDLNGSATSIEEILWQAFDVITPSNHFVSEKLVDEINRLEKGEVSKSEVLDMIKTLEVNSFDEKQKRFFDQVRNLVNNAENKSEGMHDR